MTDRLTGFFVILIAVLLGGAAVKLLGLQHPWLPLLYVVFSFSALGLSIGLAVYPLIRREALERVAQTIQEGIPELGDDLINSIQIYRQFHPVSRAHGISKRLATALIEQTAHRLRQIDLIPLLKQRPLLPGLARLLILIAAAAIMAFFNPGYIRYSVNNMLLHPDDAVEYGRMAISVEPGNTTVLKGSDVSIKVEYSRPVLSDTWLVIGQDGAQVRHKMTLVKDGSYEFELKEIPETITYFIRSRFSKSNPFVLTVIEPPMLRELNVRLIPPSYTGLETSKQKDSGNITAYPGTEATFTVSPTRDIVEAALMFKDKEQIPLKEKEDGIWQGRMALLSPESYHFRLEDSLGFSDPHPINYKIEIIPDRPPQVEIASPSQNMEMNEGEDLPITYVGRDDFGVSSIHLKYSWEGGEQKSIKITGKEKEASLLSGQYIWQLRGPEFSHSSVISYYLEAQDNDTISGPHRSVSKTYTVEIRGREEEHRRVQARLASITEDLLWLLADQLELQDGLSLTRGTNDKNAARKTFIGAIEEKHEYQGRLSEIIEEVDALIADMTMDPLSSYLTYFDLQALRKNLHYLTNTTIEKSMQALESMISGGNKEKEGKLLKLEESTTSGLEQAVLLAESAGKESKTADLAGLSSDMLKEQGGLMDMLKRLMETGDQEAANRVMDQLNRIQDMLAKFMEKLSELAQAPPEEFLNSESMQSLDLANLQELMKEIREALKQGDLGKAMELAKGLMNSLSNLMAMLQEMSSMASGRFQQFNESTRTVTDELYRMIEEQKRILGATESTHKNMTERLRRLQLEKRDEVVDSLQRELSQLLKTIEQRLKESLKRGRAGEKEYLEYGLLKRRISKRAVSLSRGEASGLSEALKGFISDIKGLAGRSSSSASERNVIGRQTGYLRRHMDILSRLSRELENLSSGPQRFTDEERLTLKELSLKQNNLREDTGRLASFLQKLSSLLPALLPEIADNMWEAESRMNQAAGGLYNDSTETALPSEREALYLLQKTMDQLKEAMNRLNASASMKGLPMPLLMGQNAPFQLPFGFLPGMGNSEGGRFGQSLRPFKIPSREEYQVPRLLREEVLEALKEGYPGEYKEEVKKYFRDLSR